MAVTAGTPILNNNGGGATTVTLALTCTAGGGVTFVVYWDSARTLSTVAGTQGKTYTLRGTQQSLNGGFARVYTAENMNSGAETITVTFSGSAVAVIAGIPANNVATASYDGIGGPTADAASPWTSATVAPSIADALLVSMAINDSTNASTNWTAGNGFTDGVEEGDGSTLWPTALGYKIVASTSADNGSWTASQGTNAVVWTVAFKGVGGGSPATLSSATPSGTLGTATSATIGATSDQTTGTLYAVVSTTNNVATATATQIKAGQNSTGAAAAFANSAAVSTTSPSVGISGLTASTAYFYAEVQNNANGDSNVVSGSFTTAAASSATNQRMTLLGVS